MAHKTDQEWETWGKIAPWYGVLSEPKYRGKELSSKAMRDFYQSGEEHVAMVFDCIHEIDATFKPTNVLDFGCGTGRLAIALAKRARHVFGVDISSSMINHAKRNQPKDIKNIQYILGDGIELPHTHFDLVHSVIVFQHMNPVRGYARTKTFLDRLEPRGFAALHYTVYDDSSKLMKFIRFLRRKSKLVNMLVNLYKHRAVGTPNMQMNMYDLGHLMKIFHDHGITDVRVLTNHPDCYVGALLIGQKH